MQYALLAVLNNWDTNDLSTVFTTVNLKEESLVENSKAQIIETVIDMAVDADEKEDTRVRNYTREELYEIWVFKSAYNGVDPPELVVKWEYADLHP